jgi:predicted metal-dependent HD superfamily phosphohydrolase
MLAAPTTPPVLPVVPVLSGCCVTGGVDADELELWVAWQRHVGRTAEARAWFESIVARHRAPGRHYHDLRHVRWVVRHVIDLDGRGLVDHPSEVVAAACFHDAVYDPSSTDNEGASGRLAHRALGEIGWSIECCDHVASMIDATAHHRLEGADRDTRALIAADLAVLAAEPTRYGDYVRAVRREYGHLDDDAWRSGRSAVLRGLIERTRLFPDGLDDWERRARANIAAELADLRQ